MSLVVCLALRLHEPLSRWLLCGLLTKLRLGEKGDRGEHSATPFTIQDSCDSLDKTRRYPPLMHIHRDMEHTHMHTHEIEREGGRERDVVAVVQSVI